MPAGELFDAWWQRIPPALRDRLVVATTQNNGRHVDYRCETAVSGNLKLAQRKTGDGIETLIETRGEGGLVLCPPTPGYKIIQGDLCNLPMLTEAERDILLTAAWELNEYTPPAVNGPSYQQAHNETKRHTGEPRATCGDPAGRPGDDFNARGDVRAVLQQHGWTLVGNGGDNERWRRPGKSAGWSATLRVSDHTFYVFSSSAMPFESNQAYSPFAVMAYLEHGGDFTAATRALSAQGYGSDDVAAPSDVDLSGIITTGDPPVDETPPDMIDPGPLPADMLRVPGFISEVMDHCLATAPYPNPAMAAFAGAVTLQAFLAGRKVRDSGDNRTNIYLLGPGTLGSRQGLAQEDQHQRDSSRGPGQRPGTGIFVRRRCPRRPVPDAQHDLSDRRDRWHAAVDQQG